MILISPPFGNWLSIEGCTRVMGSYTLRPRAGLLLQMAKTLRPIRGGWVNAIGLRNPGIRNAPYHHDRIYSLAGLEESDWEEMHGILPYGSQIEINLGCPNVSGYGISYHSLCRWTQAYKVTAKLPPTEVVYDLAALCVEAGVKYLHCSNTYPTKRGGESGARLKKINLEIIKKIKSNHPTSEIIAGGGIYSMDDILDYRRLGVEIYSLSTVFFNPLQAFKLLKEITPMTECAGWR